MANSPEWMRGKRAQRKAAGLCDYCGKVPPEPGKVSCAACLEKSKARARRTKDRRDEQGLCLQCGGKRDLPTRICSSCRSEMENRRLATPIEHRRNLNRERTRRLRERRKAARLCFRCENPAVPGATECETHLEMRNRQVADRIYGRGVKPAILERDGHRCYICGKTERLHIHHIDGNGTRKVAPNNDPANLITLCTFCHSLLEKFFRNGADPDRVCGLIHRISPFISRQKDTDG